MRNKTDLNICLIFILFFMLIFHFQNTRKVDYYEKELIRVSANYEELQQDYHTQMLLNFDLQQKLEKTLAE